MGGVSIDENMLIDKTIHDAINSKSAVIKVCDAPGTTCALSIYFICINNLATKEMLLLFTCVQQV